MMFNNAEELIGQTKKDDACEEKIKMDWQTAEQVDKMRLEEIAALPGRIRRLEREKLEDEVDYGGHSPY